MHTNFQHISDFFSNLVQSNNIKESLEYLYHVEVKLKNFCVIYMHVSVHATNKALALEDC